MADYIDSYELKNKIFSFDKYIESINQSTNIDKCKFRIETELKNIIRLIKNIEIYGDLYDMYGEAYDRYSEKYQDIYNSIYRYIEISNSSTEVLEIKTFFINNKEDFETKISVFLDLKNYNIKNILLLYDQEDYFLDNNPCEISDAVLIKIALSIQNNREINMFDPQCCNGDNLKIFNNLLSPINIYALDKDAYNVNAAKEICKHVIKGELNGSRISNGCFDFLFVSPRMQVCKKFNNKKISSESNEKYILKNTLKYLSHKGIFCYTIPFYRMTKEMWLYISKNLKDINVFKHDDLECRITIMGYKSSNNSYEENFKYLSSLEYEDIILYKNFNHIYKIENEPKEITIFRGSVLDKEEIIDLVKTDGLYKEFYKSLEKQEFENNNNPLLPFNLGQIGLVLTSGQLDGIINEFGKVNHVIKGMTVKNSVEEVDDVNSEYITSTTTTSNVVQINVIDGQGNFKTLTQGGE